MDFVIWKAILGGIVGTAAMTVVIYMGSALMGLKMDMPMTLGTMFFPKGGIARAVGLMAHLMMGAIFFIIYAALFAAFGIHSAILGWAVLFGIIHGLVAGTAFGMMPAIHPRMASNAAASSDGVPAPGFLALNMGMIGPVALLMVHAVFGLVAAAIYLA